jgi:hypothetical protein
MEHEADLEVERDRSGERSSSESESNELGSPDEKPVEEEVDGGLDKKDAKASVKLIGMDRKARNGLDEILTTAKMT